MVASIWFGAQAGPSSIVCKWELTSCIGFYTEQLASIVTDSLISVLLGLRKILIHSFVISPDCDPCSSESDSSMSRFPFFQERVVLNPDYWL